MRQSACELVHKGKVKTKGYALDSVETTSGRKIYLCGGRYDARTDEPLNECRRCPLFVSRYTFVVMRRSLLKMAFCGQKSISVSEE